MGERISKTKISIIVPLYNAENYVRECIENLLEQTYTNLEIILVNDGSTDASASICREYVKKHINICYLEQENKGAAAARNLGMRHATGEYIAFVDCDDSIVSCYIEKLYEILKREDVELVCCSYIKGAEKEKRKFGKTKQKKATKVLSQEEGLESLFYRKELMGYPCCKLICREFLADIIFPEDLRLGEDFVLSYHLIQKCNKIAYTYEELYFYFQAPNSVTHSLQMEDMEKWWNTVMLMYKEQEKNVGIAKAIRSKQFILACDFLTRLRENKTGFDFDNSLLRFVKENKKEILFDRKGRISNKVLAGLCMVNERATIIVCYLTLKLLRKAKIHVKKAL